MDRRSFIAALAFGVALPCACALHAEAKLLAKGCRREAAGSNTEEANEIRGLLRPSTGYEFHDKHFASLARSYAEIFGVRPGFSFYEDGPGRDSNALADPVAYFPDDGPDGTVMIGLNLLNTFRRNYLDISKPLGGADVVMAHEFGHIVQFKRNVPWSWEMEPHADFLAGWAIAKQHERTRNNVYNRDGRLRSNAQLARDLEQSAETMFGFGDTAFTDPNHHGQPHFRAVMVRAGYESGNLSLEDAFAKGAHWAKFKIK